MEENNIINIHRLSDPNNRRSGPNLSTGEYTYLNGDIYKGQYHVDEYGKYMSGRFTTEESKELIKIGDALDVINAIIYFWRDKYFEGFLSLVAIIPVVGSVISLGVKSSIARNSI